MVSTPEQESSSYLSENDPHKRWLERARKEAAGILSNAEQKVAQPPTTSNLEDQRQAEKSPRTFRNNTTQKRTGRSGNTWSNKVTSKKSSSQDRKDSNLSNKINRKKRALKKAGPLGAIAAVLFSAAAFFFVAQSMLPAHLSALYTQATDLQYTAYNLRNVQLTSFILNGNNQNSFTDKYTNLTSYMQGRLEKNGIKVGHLNSDGVFETGQAENTVLQYDGKIINADSFQDEIASNPNFRESYYNAKLNRVSNFYDESADDFFGNSLGTTTRNIFQEGNYDAAADPEERTTAFQDIINEHTTGGSGTINTAHSEIDQETGESTTKTNGEAISADSLDGVDSTAKARSLVNHLAGKVSSVGVPICAALRLANIANIAISSLQIAQSIAYFLSFMEPINQMMYGKTGTSSVNEVLNNLTQPATSTVDYVDENGQSITKTVTGSAIEAAGSKLILGKTISPESDYQPYSLDGLTSAITRIAIGTGATTAVCSGITAASAVISLTKYAIPGGNIAFFALGAVAKTIGRIAFVGVVATIINAIIPRLAKMFTPNVFETYTGIAAGELFTQGAAAANFSLATKGSALMPATEEQVKTQNRYTAIALAQEAEVDRLHRSPFDASSPNTFLGSIMSKFSYLSYSNPLIHGTASIASVVGSSIRSLIPAAAAADQDLSYTSQNHPCAKLKNAVCDVYDHPIVGFNYETINTKPDDPEYVASISPNLNEDGSIKDGSELAKFITVCSGRESEWGVPDASIRSALRSNNNIVLNELPIVGEVTDLIGSAEDVINSYEGWDTGEACSKPENKYYQLYVLDMRILRSMDDPKTGATNPVHAYRQKYREAHPLDNSFEGTLSRISGLSKDDIAFLLEYIDYSTEIANYNPSERLKFGPHSEPQPVALNVTESKTPTINLLSSIFEPIFIDRRNYTL